MKKKSIRKIENEQDESKMKTKSKLTKKSEKINQKQQKKIIRK